MAQDLHSRIGSPCSTRKGNKGDILPAQADRKTQRANIFSNGCPPGLGSFIHPWTPPPPPQQRCIGRGAGCVPRFQGPRPMAQLFSS